MKKVGLFLVMIGAVALIPLSAHAVTPIADSCTGVKAGESAICDGKNENVTGFLTNIINFLLLAVGALAVVMIIVGGIKYILSAGDSSKLTSAKNTILYSVLGLIIAVLAYSIVNWVYLEATKVNTGGQSKPGTSSP